MTRWLVGLAVLLALGGVAAARPGGGQSYSGGGYSSSSGGGSFHSSSSGGGGYSSGGGAAGDNTLVAIGMFVMLAIMIVALALSTRPTHWTSSGPDAPDRALRIAPPTFDPDFSQAVFEDFVFQLYSAAQRARRDDDALAALAPYLSEVAAAKLAQRQGRVVQVAIGVLQVVGEQVRAVEPARWQLTVRFESNLGCDASTIACVESWIFTRAMDVKTAAPTGTRTWPCPNCGAPWAAGEDPRTCAHCNQAIRAGRFDWAVDDLWVDSETDVGQTLTGTVEEVGNDYPTVIARDAGKLFSELSAADPAVTQDAIVARATMIYQRVNEAWNADQLTPVRGLVTKSLLDYLNFWLDQYRRQGLKNRLDGASLTRAELAKVVRDHHYDAITLRMFASGHDVTVDSKDQVVGGSRTAFRPYTEYWTFLRSAGRRGAVLAAPNCPSCGAPLAISDRGACTHCQAEIEAGAFDWVLSKIEQDDAYRG